MFSSKPKTRHLEGVVTGRKDLFELDKVITLITPNEGRVKLLAKGVRSPKSRRLGHLELGNKVKTLVIKGKSFDLIAEVEVIENCLAVRKNDLFLAGTIFLCELVNQLLPENDPNDPVYQRFLEVLESVKKGKLNQLVVFEFYLLKTLGYGISEEEDRLFEQKNWRQLHLALKKRIEYLIEKPLKSLAIFN